MRRRQALGGRLDRYVAAHFLGSFALAAGLLVGLFVVLDAAGELPYDLCHEWICIQISKASLDYMKEPACMAILRNYAFLSQSVQQDDGTARCMCRHS